MTVQIDQIFTARAENVWQFLHAAGQGCYIPAYQRPYAWDGKNVDRLIEDAINGLDHLASRSSAISFLGTVIAIHDVNNVTVKPVYQSEVAQKVMTLIDGQQRISTFIMFNMALHHQISVLLKRIDKIEGEEFDWMRDQGKRALSDLWMTFALDQVTGVPEVYRFYPRVIRAFDDVWSKKGSQAIYASPIARLIWAYITHVEAKNSGQFNHKVAENGVDDPKHKNIVSVFRYIRKQLELAAGKKSGTLDFPNLQQLIINEEFMKALWSFTPPEAVVRYITEQSDHNQFEPMTFLLRSLMFYKYFNTRMALTIVTTRSEDDAFDMFEALNTTGEPLTAFETFKPKIIEAETLANYQQSPSYKNVSLIEEYLDEYKGADERQRATSELLIPFALSETGDKLQKHLSDQRRYLRDYFETVSTIDEKRDVVASLANLSTFLRTAWFSDKADIEVANFGKFDPETDFCFQSLKALKHTIVIGALARFYDELARSDDDKRQRRKEEFAAAIRAITSFSMLWRAGFGTTEGIDSIYRSLMRDGDADVSILPLGKRPNRASGAVSLVGLRRILWARFLKSFPDKDAWVKAATKIPIYANSVPVAKFLLIVASDDAAPDPLSNGLLIRGTKGLSTTIDGSAWGSDNHFSVEHIAPQSTKALGWSETLYEEPNIVNRLGNLTLLPAAANAYIGTRSWVHKRLLYSYLSAETPAEAEIIYSSFTNHALNISQAGQAIFANSKFMPMCKSLGKYTADWDVNTLDTRSARLAELVFDRIVGWLKPESD